MTNINDRLIATLKRLAFEAEARAGVPKKFIAEARAVLRDAEQERLDRSTTPDDAAAFQNERTGQ